MGFWSSIIWREVDDEPVSTSREAVNELPELYNGMTLDLETTDGVHILTGRLTGYAPDDTALSLERLPGGLSCGHFRAGPGGHRVHDSVLPQGDDSGVQPADLPAEGREGEVHHRDAP